MNGTQRGPRLRNGGGAWGVYWNNPWRGLEYEAEFLPEPAGGAPHLGLHRAQRHAGADGDLLIGELIAAAQQEDLATAGGELQDGVLHRRLQLLGQVQLFRRLGNRGWLAAGALHPGVGYVLMQ